MQSVQQSRSPAGLGEQPDHQPLASGQQVLQRLAHMVEGIGRGYSPDYAGYFRIRESKGTPRCGLGLRGSD